MREATASAPLRENSSHERIEPVGELLDAVRWLRAAIPPGDRRIAGALLATPVHLYGEGSTVPVAGRAAHVLLDGLVLRRTALGRRTVCEVLGRGDVLTRPEDDDGSSLPVHVDYVVHRRAAVAALDDRLERIGRRWPGVPEALRRQLERQIMRASRNLAILSLPRVEDRLRAVFVELADQWGRVTGDGILLDVQLTHTLLGELAGARRPTVSLALAQMADGGEVVRRVDHRWLLAADLFAGEPAWAA